MKEPTCATCRWWETVPDVWPDGIARSGLCTMIRGNDDRWSVVEAQIVDGSGNDAPHDRLVTGRRFFCQSWEEAS